MFKKSLPPILIIDLDIFSVSGLSRVARPPANMAICIASFTLLIKYQKQLLHTPASAALL